MFCATNGHTFCTPNDVKMIGKNGIRSVKLPEISLLFNPSLLGGIVNMLPIISVSKINTIPEFSLLKALVRIKNKIENVAIQATIETVWLNSKKLLKMLLVPAKYAQSNANDKAYNDIIDIDFAIFPDISFDNSTMVNALPRFLIRSIVKHEVLYDTHKAIPMITNVHLIPSLAAEIGNDINPEPIAVPEIKKTEFTNLLIIISPQNEINKKFFEIYKKSV